MSSHRFDALLTNNNKNNETHNQSLTTRINEVKNTDLFIMINLSTMLVLFSSSISIYQWPNDRFLNGSCDSIIVIYQLDNAIERTAFTHDASISIIQKSIPNLSLFPVPCTEHTFESMSNFAAIANSFNLLLLFISSSFCFVSVWLTLLISEFLSNLD